jgi:hypothetical protein
MACPGLSAWHTSLSPGSTCDGLAATSATAGNIASAKEGVVTSGAAVGGRGRHGRSAYSHPGTTPDWSACMCCRRAANANGTLLALGIRTGLNFSNKYQE